MTKHKLDDNPFDYAERLKPKEVDLCLLSVCSAVNNVLKLIAGQENKIAILTEKPGQKFEPTQKTKYVIDYEKSSLDARIYEQCAPATVEIAGRSRTKKDWTITGSGSVIDSRGLVITNDHVVSDMKTAYARLNDGRVYKLKCLIEDPQHDLALLKIEGGNNDFRYLKLANLEPKPGTKVWGIGHPHGVLELCLAPGTIDPKKSVSAHQWETTLKQHCEHGDSGSPEVNVKGELVGVVHAHTFSKQVEANERNKVGRTRTAKELTASAAARTSANLRSGHKFDVIKDEYHSLAVSLEWIKSLRNSVVLDGDRISIRF